MVSKSRDLNGNNANPKLTPSQEQILAFIKQCYERRGLPPTYREIQEHFGYKAIGTVQDHLKALRKKSPGPKNPRMARRLSRGPLPEGA